MLTPEQRQEFFERGFTRVEGALPEAAVATMLSRIWQALEKRKGMRRNDPSTWIPGGVRGIGDINREPEFQPFGTPQIEAIIDSFLGPGQWRKPPGWGQILATFPAQTWSWNSLFQDEIEVEKIMWHTDYPYDTPLGELSGVQVFGLLADLDTGGGGTLVIEGSHRMVESFVREQPPQTLAKMKRARQALLQSDPWIENLQKAVSMPRPEAWMAEQQAVVHGAEVKVTELTGRATDLYLSHPWLLHAACPNCNTTPRLMCTQRIHRLE